MRLSQAFAGPDDYTGPAFELFGDEHLIALTLVVLFQVLIVDRGRAAGPRGRRAGRLALASALWGQELAYHAWRWAQGSWTPEQMLPLHLCSVGVVAGGAALLTRSHRLYELLYFSGITGATIALITPDIERFAAPHFRFVQFFVSHGLILAVPVWLTAVEGRRPTPRSLALAVGALGLHGAIAFAVNRRLGSNYLFVNRKPDTASPLDLLPPWPRYLPVMGTAVTAIYSLLYLPWAVRDARGC